LISEARVRIIGPVRQEILSGIKSERQFKQLKHHLAAFPDVPSTIADFEYGASHRQAQKKRRNATSTKG
jgi:hypothetical protein